MRRNTGRGARGRIDWERTVSAVAAAYLLIVQLVLLGVSTGVSAGHQLDGTSILCNGVASNAAGGLPTETPGGRDLCCIVFGGLPADAPLAAPTLERPNLAVLDTLAAPPSGQHQPETRPAAHGARAPPAPATV